MECRKKGLDCIRSIFDFRLLFCLCDNRIVFLYSIVLSNFTFRNQSDNRFIFFIITTAPCYKY